MKSYFLYPGLNEPWIRRINECTEDDQATFMGNTELMATVGTTTMADSLTWGKIGKRLVLGGGLILIPFIPGIISKITDIPNQMMERGYEVHWLREPKRKHELKIGKNLFSEGNAPAFISDPEEEVAGND